MRSLILAISLLSGSAVAATIQPLTIPHTYQHIVQCTASPASFNANGSVNGVCRDSGPTSLRYAKRPWVQYPVVWDANGLNPVIGAWCAQQASWVSNPPPVVYNPGSSAYCALNPTGTGSVVTVNGVPMYYVATSVNGTHETVANYGSASLVAF